MLLYVGPDQIIPLSGAIGTVVGVALIFWGKVVQAFHKLAGLFSSKPSSPEKATSEDKA